MMNNSDFLELLQRWLDTFDNDPPDSDFQKGYQQCLIDLYDDIYGDGL